MLVTGKDDCAIEGILTVSKVFKDKTETVFQERVDVVQSEESEGDTTTPAGSGSVEEVFKEENLILKYARQKATRLIYLDTELPDPIRKLTIGVGGTIDPEGRHAKLPSINQVNLYNPIEDIVTTAVPGASGMSVTFLADLDYEKGNGELISEAGLVTKSGKLFNVKNFPGIPKTSDFAIHFEWEILVGTN